MTHTDIEERQVVERYLQGKLPAELAAEFEEHYLSCPQCLDRLETTAELALSLKAAVADDVAAAAGVAAVRQLAVLGWLARLGRSRQAALLLPLLLAALVVPGVAWYSNVRLGRELRDARTALAAGGSRDSADLAASRRALTQEQEQRAALARDLALAREPQADVPVLYLGSERGGRQRGRGRQRCRRWGGGGERGAGEPTYRLRLPRRPGTVVLSLPVEPAPGRTWRVVLSRAGGGGTAIWRSAPLTLHQDTLAVAIPSGLLAPGDHVLAVEEVAAPGRSAAAAARFTFRALAPLPG
jgi:hypothetical protein